MISVSAEMEGFVISGPDSNGVFTAHKLAEIIVQVSDQADNVSLPVSLRGYLCFQLRRLGILWEFCC